MANLFKPEDQKEVVDVFNNYAEKYAEYEFDEDDFNFEVGGKSMLTVMAKSMVKGHVGRRGKSVTGSQRVCHQL